MKNLYSPFQEPYSIRDIDVAGLRVSKDSIQILDQQLIPAKEEWLSVESPEEMVEYIKALKVRGAPMIALSAAVTLARYAENVFIGSGTEENKIARIQETADLLKNARPTAVNLSHAINDMMRVPTQYWKDGALWEKALEICDEDARLCDKIARNGLSLLPKSGHCLTICNTGRIATGGLGTALGIFYKAHEMGFPIEVFACETRPLLQGGRLTAWELKKFGVPCTILVDSAAGALMQSGKVDAVFVGADRIARNGDTANKIGSYSLAVLAHHHGIPFYVVAPYTTVDASCKDGSQIEIEQRPMDEVRGVQGSFGSVFWAPEDIPAYNPAFDVTPSSLITGIILDTGYFDGVAIKEGKHLG